MGRRKALGFFFRKWSNGKPGAGGDGDVGAEENNGDTEDTKDCCICMEPLITPDNLRCVCTPCGHKFHRRCLLNWCKTDNRRQCPMCRGEVSEEDLIPWPAEKSELIGVIGSLVTKLQEQKRQMDEERLGWALERRGWEERQNQWAEQSRRWEEQRLQLNKERQVLEEQNRMLQNWRQSERYSNRLNDGIGHLDEEHLGLEDHISVLKDKIKTIGITLGSNCRYLFDGLNIGTFYLKGGSCGKFTVENKGQEKNCTVNIVDDQGALVLSAGHSPGDSTTVEDNPVEGTTAVIYTKLGRRELEHPIQIRATSSEVITLTGRRSFVITGSDFELEFDGSGVVTVEGDPKRVQMSAGKGGGGVVKVKGSVNGNVIQNGDGCRLFVDGSVKGDLKQFGEGRIEVFGSVQGDIEKDGKGKIYVGRFRRRW